MFDLCPSSASFLFSQQHHPPSSSYWRWNKKKTVIKLKTIKDRQWNINMKSNYGILSSAICVFSGIELVRLSTPFYSWCVCMCVKVLSHTAAGFGEGSPNFYFLFPHPPNTDMPYYLKNIIQELSGLPYCIPEPQQISINNFYRLANRLCCE